MGLGRGATGRVDRNHDRLDLVVLAVLHKLLDEFLSVQNHTVELEMQNEELRRAQKELEGARARYFDLYDLAPVGYLTIGEKGLVEEANLFIDAAHKCEMNVRQQQAEQNAALLVNK